MEEAESAEKKGRRRGMLLWSINGVGLLVGYVLVYPALYIYLDSDPGPAVADHLPDWFFTALEVTLWPLGVFYDESPGYEAYIDWLGERIDP